jgi:translocator protein
MTGTRLYTNFKTIRMKLPLILRISGSAAFLIMLAVNVLANVLPINGLNTGNVAALYPNLFTPASFTFSIWTVIYLLLFGFNLYFWVNRGSPVVTGILPYFIASCILNAAWILAWHHLMTLLSVLIMLALLFVLVYIFVYTHHSMSQRKSNFIFFRLPFTIYLGWITVTTIANIAAYMVSTGWNGLELSPEFWTVLMMGIATVVIVRIFMVYNSPAIVAVLIWALIGIFARWAHSDFRYVLYAAGLFIVALVATTVYHLKKRKLS